MDVIIDGKFGALSGSLLVIPYTANDAPTHPLSSARRRASAAYLSHSFRHRPSASARASWSTSSASAIATRPLPGFPDCRQHRYRRTISRSSTPSVSNPRRTKRLKSSRSTTATSPTALRATAAHRRRFRPSARFLRSRTMALASDARAFSAASSSRRLSSFAALRSSEEGRKLSSFRSARQSESVSSRDVIARDGMGSKAARGDDGRSKTRADGQSESVLEDV
eukprot:31073-Pelagococcus_subviridis.AAC.5